MPTFGSHSGTLKQPCFTMRNPLATLPVTSLLVVSLSAIDISYMYADRSFANSRRKCEERKAGTDKQLLSHVFYQHHNHEDLAMNDDKSTSTQSRRISAARG